MNNRFLLASWLFGFGNSISSPLIALFIYVSSTIYYSLIFLVLNSFFILVGYLMVGFISSRIKESMIYYRIGISLYVLFYLLLAILNKSAFEFVYELAAVYGIAQGFYWAGWDIIFFNTDNKLKFFNRSAYLGVISSIASPAIYGAILSLLRGYGYVVLFMASTAILTSILFVVKNVPFTSEKFDMNKAIKMHVVDKSYGLSTIALSLIAGANYILGNINSIILYKYAQGDYTTFSIINYSLSIVSMLSVYIVRDKLVKKLNPVRLPMLAALALAISIPFMWVSPLIYLYSFSLTSPLIYPIIDVFTWNYMKRDKMIYYLVNRQIFLNTTRILSSLTELYLMSIMVGSTVVLPILPLILMGVFLFIRLKPRKEKITE
ncbi:hypothetical protein GCM10007981_03760 [Thermocladium modestius]|uniref:MFS transporter n=1 Tax=Thermocladium modestius TaxID=62609 RepID=A0A830GT20_9CREN|nr:hypothetical protein [Thermocladium modestius]GGP19565.1 hypothetical protein GCM10007981_03760 [Thermocladium modestius]